MSGDNGLIKTKTQNSRIIFFTFSKDPILRGQIWSINCHKKCKCACYDRFQQTLPSTRILFDLNRQPNCVFPSEKISPVEKNSFFPREPRKSARELEIEKLPVNLKSARERFSKKVSVNF